MYAFSQFVHYLLISILTVLTASIHNVVRQLLHICQKLISALYSLTIIVVKPQYCENCVDFTLKMPAIKNRTTFLPCCYLV